MQQTLTKTRRWTKKRAVEITGGLSNPSKMPGYAYNLPASQCILGGKLRGTPGSVCWKCYALKGRYVFKYVQRALQRRFASLKHPEWVEAMAFLINRVDILPPLKAGGYFRWHDSGDLQGVWHLKNIAEVCRLTPLVRHWLPTREYGIVKAFVEEGGAIPPNLTIRLSAHLIDADPPTKLAKKLGVCTSTVSSAPLTAPAGGDETNWVCPALLQGNSCGDCRACWVPSFANVQYALH